MEKPKKLSMEEQLALYRKRKMREEQIEAVKKKVWGFFSPSRILDIFTPTREPENSSLVDTPAGPESPKETEKVPGHSGDNLSLKRRRREKMVNDNDLVEEEPVEESSSYTTLDWVILLLKVAVWLLLQKVFILLEFGAVFFIFSVFVFIGYNLRSGPRKKGEASAYSVFNPNCEAIDGTFTAEQFERELLHRM